MMVDPLVDEVGRTIAAARLMAGWRLVVFLHPDGFVYVQVGDCVANLSGEQAMRELTDSMLELRRMQEAGVCE